MENPIALMVMTFDKHLQCLLNPANQNRFKQYPVVCLFLTKGMYAVDPYIPGSLSFYLIISTPGT